MRRKLVGLGIAAGVSTLTAAAVFSFGAGGSPLADGSNYRGEQNGLPTAGLPIPVLLYGNADTSPAGFVGVSQGSALTYAQVSANGSGGQVEANAAPAGQSIWVNSDGNTGSC